MQRLTQPPHLSDLFQLVRFRILLVCHLEGGLIPRQSLSICVT